MKKNWKKYLAWGLILGLGAVVVYDHAADIKKGVSKTKGWIGEKCSSSENSVDMVESEESAVEEKVEQPVVMKDNKQFERRPFKGNNNWNNKQQKVA